MKRSLELYFHIPFCVKKCAYCDFLSAPAGEQDRRAYMEALRAETIGRAPEYRDYTVVSVFIGGGTPSVVEKEQIGDLLTAVRECYDLAEDAEITMEVNPGTVTEEKLRFYHEAGVNRLSIGLQSTHDDELKMIGRIHTFAQFLEAYQGAVAAGFTNINVDLMSALPGQNAEKYRQSLETVLDLTPPPRHISAYSLILEENTPLYDAVEQGKVTLPGEDADRELYEMTEAILKAKGYHRYEISNYAKTGYECRHNVGYWIRREYVGFGIGAASLVDHVRFKNGDQLAIYLQDPLGCREETEILSKEAEMEEFLFLGLRLTEGISPENFEAQFGTSLRDVFGEVIEKNIEDGLLAYSEDEKRLALTERGLDLSNYVFAQFLLT